MNFNIPLGGEILYILFEARPAVTIPVMLIVLVVQLVICFRAQSIVNRLTPVLIIIFSWIFAALLSNSFALDNVFLAFIMPTLIVMPALIGDAIAWIIFGICRIPPLNKNAPEGASDTAGGRPLDIADIGRGILKYIWVLFPLGMAGVVFYFIFELSFKLFIDYYTVFGEPTYKPIFFFELCFLIFAVSMFINALRKYHPITWTGYFLLLLVAVISIITYSRSPNFNSEVSIPINLWRPENVVFDLHVSGLIIVLMLLLLYLLAIGYIKKEEMIPVGVLSLGAAGIMTFFAIAHLIEIRHDLTGFTQTTQVLFFTQLVYIFCLSFAYTFRVRRE